MCDNSEWQPFQVVEKESGEPLHRCYQRCTEVGCTDIRVRLFSENTIEILGGGMNQFNDPSITEIE